MVVEKPHVRPVWDLFVRLQKPLLNDDYAARRSICAFSAVEGMWAVRAYRVVLRRFDECDSQRRLFDPTEPLLLRGGGLQTTRPNLKESRCSSNTAQTPTMLWRGHMLMILARLVRSESFWAVVKVRSPHTGPEFGYPRKFVGLLGMRQQIWAQHPHLVSPLEARSTGV